MINLKINSLKIQCLPAVDRKIENCKLKIISSSRTPDN